MADIINEDSCKKKCGSVGYVAPEIFLSKGYDEKVDVFSLGIIFYTLCYKTMPF
jgi:calcium/calmodulin-dependent protein kinase I